MPVERQTAHELFTKAKGLFDEVRVTLSDPNASAEALTSAREKRVDAEALKSRAMDLQALEKSMGEFADEEIKQVADPEASGNFGSWGRYLRAVWIADQGKYMDPRLTRFNDPEPKTHGGSKKDMVEAVGASGGFLVPEENLGTVMSVMQAESVVRSRATIIPMRRRQIDIPVLDQTGVTAGMPHWFGGMQFYWLEEAGEKTATDPKFRQISLVAHKLIGFTRASDELVDDAAISLDAFLSGPMGFAGGAAWMEDYAFLNGTGAGQPLGILNSNATIEIERETINRITYADLINMLANFLPSGRGVWIASQSALAELMTMAGPSGNASYLWGNLNAGVPSTLLGMPIIWTEKSPALGSVGDIGLFDFRYYLIGDRQATTIESTKFDKWQFDMTSWRMVHRVDGQPWLSAPLTYFDGTTTISPFVVLGDPA